MDPSAACPCRTFSFAIHGMETELQISEVYSGDYGCIAWPSSIVLSTLIARHSSLFSSARVLELGCGVGLPGIVAAKCGSVVHLTDVGQPAGILENCRDNCKRNHVDSKCHVVLSSFLLQSSFRCTGDTSRRSCCSWNPLIW